MLEKKNPFTPLRLPSNQHCWNTRIGGTWLVISHEPMFLGSHNIQQRHFSFFSHAQKSYLSRKPLAWFQRASKCSFRKLVILIGKKNFHFSRAIATTGLHCDNKGKRNRMRKRSLWLHLDVVESHKTNPPTQSLSHSAFACVVYRLRRFAL